MAIADYNLRIPVEVTGQQQMQQLWDAIRGNSQAFRGLTDSQKEFVRQARESIGPTQTIVRGLDDMRKSSSGATEGVKSLAGQLASYIIYAREAESQTNRLQQAVGKIGGRLGGMASGIPGGGFMGSQLMGALGLSGGAAVGIGAGAVGLFAAFDLTKQIDELGKWVQKQETAAAALGMTTVQMEMLTRVGERVGVNFEGIAKSVSGMKDKLLEGGAAADKTRETLSRIGLGGSTAFKNPADAIADIAHALAKIPDEAQRAQRGYELLGDAGRELAAQAENFDKASARTGMSGGIFSQETINRLKEEHQTMIDLKEAWDGVLSSAAKPATFLLKFVKTLFDDTSTQSGPQGLARDSKYDPTTMEGAAASNRARANAGVTQSIVSSAIPAGITDYELKAYETYKQNHGTYADQKAAQVEALRAKEADISRDIAAGKISGSEGGRQYGALEAQIKSAQDAAEAARRRESELRSQQEAFGKLQMPVDPHDAIKLFQELPKRFDQMTNDPRYKALYGQLQSGFMPQNGMPGPYLSNLSREMVQKQIGDKGFAFGMTPTVKEDREWSEDQRIQREHLETIQKQLEADIKATDSKHKAQMEQETTVAGGQLSAARISQRFTPNQLAGMDYADQIKMIQEQRNYAVAPLQGVLTDPNAHLSATEQDTIHKQIDTADIEAKTKSIEALNKWTDAVQESDQKMVDMWSKGFSSLVLGAQNGGARGVKRSLRGFWEGQEGTVLNNLGTTMFGSADENGLLPHISKDNPLSKLFQGTVFGAKGGDHPEVTSNTTATDRNTVATDKLSTVLTTFNPRLSGEALPQQINGGAGSANAPVWSFLTAGQAQNTGMANSSGWSFVTAGQATPEGSSSTDFFSNMVPSFMSDTSFAAPQNIPLLQSLSTADESDPTSYAATIAGLGGLGGLAVVGGSTSAAAQLKSVGGTLSGLASFFKGTNAVGNFGFFPGQTSPFGTQPVMAGGQQLSTMTGFDADGNPTFGPASESLPMSQQFGAAAGDAAAAAGAVGGIMMASKGGAKNVVGGISATLGAIAPFTGPAAPFVEAAAALGSIVSAFLPNGQTQRANQIQKTLFTQQYLAPQAINMTEGPNGGYSDVNQYGAVRTSNFSPYPVVSNSYLDVPRRTVVPGHTISQFGGYLNATGAKTPPTNVYNMISAIDTQSFAEALNKNSGAVLDATNLGLTKGSHPVVNTLAQQMGSR